MSIVVYYLEDGEPSAVDYADNEFGVAMKHMEEMRKAGMEHVIMSNSPAGLVGRPGVDSIKDGKTPDGHVYEWSKAGRAGKMRKRDATVRNDGEES